MKVNNFLLVSVKSKKSQSPGDVYIVAKEDISSFIATKLDESTMVLIDTVETFVSSPLSVDDSL